MLLMYSFLVQVVEGTGRKPERYTQATFHDSRKLGLSTYGPGEACNNRAGRTDKNLTPAHPRALLFRGIWIVCLRHESPHCL